jgi:hypothetical protein
MFRTCLHQYLSSRVLRLHLMKKSPNGRVTRSPHNDTLAPLSLTAKVLDSNRLLSHDSFQEEYSVSKINAQRSKKM